MSFLHQLQDTAVKEVAVVQKEKEVKEEQTSIKCATARPSVIDSEGPSSIIKDPNIRSFVAKSVLARFTRFLGVRTQPLTLKAQTKHCQIGQLHY